MSRFTELPQNEKDVISWMIGEIFWIKKTKRVRAASSIRPLVAHRWMKSELRVMQPDPLDTAGLFEKCWNFLIAEGNIK